MRTAYDENGVDWVSLVIPPQDPENEAEYVIRFNVSFLMSNWNCIFGRGCPGVFADQDSQYADDTGCCGDSFYVTGHDDIDNIQAHVDQLTPEDWDDELRAHVDKKGWLKVLKEKKDGDIDAKGRVYEHGCVFQNRNNGSTGKPGCAFVHMAARKGLDHIDVMPEVCWMLPIRYAEVDENVYELGAWTIDQWHTAEYPWLDFRYTHRWWCVDSPEAYDSSKMFYRTMERELRKVVGDRAYDLIAANIEKRIADGWKPMPMPGATKNEGRPLLPLLIGNRTPRREPSPYPAILQQMADGSGKVPSTTE